MKYRKNKYFVVFKISVDFFTVEIIAYFKGNINRLADGH